MNTKCFIILSVISMSVGLASSDEYSTLINMADILYYSPDPNADEAVTSMKSLTEFEAKSDVKVIIHGFLGGHDHVSIQPIRNAYLSRGDDAVFVADWSNASHVEYFTARYFVFAVAMRLAEILDDFLSINDIPLEKVHILGHSLGAHIAGNMGRYFNGSIGRITGLDPAYPLFNEQSIDDLRKTDAKFVDVIHTGAQVLGDSKPRGHVDFYPNFGVASQPGCKTLDIVTFAGCSHFRAPLFYAESIRLPNNFLAFECSYEGISRQSENICLIWNMDKRTVVMGEDVPKNTKGIYFLQTNNVPPYGLGLFTKLYLTDNSI